MKLTKTLYKNYTKTIHELKYNDNNNLRIISRVDKKIKITEKTSVIF